MKLAALSLPSHPFAFARIETATTVQQKEAVPFGARTVESVQVRNRLRADRQQGRVRFEVLAVGVDPVRQEREGEIATGPRKEMHLQALDVFDQVGFARQQRRHDDERAQRRRNAGRQREAWQQAGSEARCDCAVDQRGRDFGGGQKPQKTDDRQPSPTCARQRRHRQREQARRDQHDQADIAAYAKPDIETSDEQPRRRAKSDRAFKRAPASRDQVISRIGGVRGRVGLGFRSVQRAFRDRDLGERRAARQLLDSAAVQIAGREVHGGEAAGGPQALID